MGTAPTRFFAFPLTLGAVLLGLSACGTLHWQKTGGDNAELAKDLSDCRGQAQARLGTPANLGQFGGYDSRFGPPPGPSQADQMMQESQATGVCMRQRGYVLGPDTK